MSPMKVPFVDLRAQHDEVRDEIESTIREIIDQSQFIGGERVASFEKKFAAFCGARHAVACASGTDALKLALMAGGVAEGDEVITVPNTFIATVEAITQVRARCTFVDIDPETYNLSPQNLAEFLEKQCFLGGEGHLLDARTGLRITAVLVVHLYGQPADMTDILEIAGRYNLKVIEDACQAHGATYRINDEDRRVGTLGLAGAFSFFPGKNLGAMGEGGAVTTNDDLMDRHMRIWRDHGQSERYVHVSPFGWNGRLDAMQCAILEIKLRKLDEWNERRRRAAAWYRERLAGDPRISLPRELPGRKHVYHLFAVRVPDRDKSRQYLTAQGIGVGLHYPIALHLQQAYLCLGWQPGDFPESEAAAASILSLPIFPHISEEQVDYVCRSLKEILG